MITPQVSILTVGTELLTGKTVDTNGAFLARELFEMGFRVRRKLSVHDDSREMTEALSGSLRDSELVLVSGGLGPTPDDITKKVLSDYFGKPLRVDRQELARIRKTYPAQARAVPEFVRIQAEYPVDTELLENPLGVAQGLVFRGSQRLCIAIPGVPQEARAMFRGSVRPLLRKAYPALRSPATACFKTAGQNESSLMKQLGPKFTHAEGISFGCYPEIGEVTLRVQNNSCSDKKFLELKRYIRSKLRPWLYAEDESGLAETLVRKLTLHKRSIACAESCTGGWISKRLTDIAGSSKVFRGSVVVYSNEAKRKLLGIPRAILTSHGAVSAHTARLMAERVREVFGSCYGLAVTGIAGPSGGSASKPVGLTYIGLADGRKTRIYKFIFHGERKGNRLRAAQKSLLVLKDHLWGTQTTL